MTTPTLRLSTVTLDCPDPHALAGFYSALLGWPIDTDEPDWATVRDPSGGVGLAFQRETNFRAPNWPLSPASAQLGAQQMMLHLEIKVDDLDAAREHATGCGAVESDFQPQQDVRVCIDPGRPSVLPVPRLRAGGPARR